jgi:hypothetical protein
MVLAGPAGALVGCLTPLAWRRLSHREERPPTMTLVALLILIELRAGSSVLAALTSVSASLPRYESLRVVSRVAAVSGLVAALEHADATLRPIVAQLARSQRSGASLTLSMRRLLETELAADRSRRIARARALPVRLIMPVTLLMLPGLVMFLYAPSLLATFQDLTGVLW